MLMNVNEMKFISWAPGTFGGNQSCELLWNSETHFTWVWCSKASKFWIFQSTRTANSNSWYELLLYSASTTRSYNSLPDPLDYSTSRGGGLPSLLSFSSNSNSPSHMRFYPLLRPQHLELSLRSPPRRLLPEPELEISLHDDPLNSQPWRSMDS